jgi:hypothetical protein
VHETQLRLNIEEALRRLMMAEQGSFSSTWSRSAPASGMPFTPFWSREDGGAKKIEIGMDNGSCDVSCEVNNRRDTRMREL